MKKSTVLSLTTAAVILAAYVPNEVILADTPSSEDSLKISDKETVVGKQNENKERPRKKFWQNCLQRQNCRAPSGRRKTGMPGWNRKRRNRLKKKCRCIWRNIAILPCI